MDAVMVANNVAFGGISQGRYSSSIHPLQTPKAKAPKARQEPKAKAAKDAKAEADSEPVSGSGFHQPVKPSFIQLGDVHCPPSPDNCGRLRNRFPQNPFGLGGGFQIPPQLGFRPGKADA